MSSNPEIDPTSDRYKRCKYCDVEFMAEHRGMKFDTRWCADEFHNRKKRLEKQGIIQDDNQEQLPQNSIENISTPDLPDIDQEELANNIRLIDQIELDPVEGTVVQMEQLHQKGYIFPRISDRGILYNIDPSLNCHFMQVGVYRLFRVSFSHVLIKKID